MASSLYAGVSGLRAHQQMLDVVGNNLANVNTTGFKSQRADFGDLVYQTLRPATGSTSSQIGGTDPLQVGLGVNTIGISTNLQQGGLEATGSSLDMAIEGNGYFLVNDGNRTLYTRDGKFGVDNNNMLVDPQSGFRVQRFGSVGEGSATAPAFQAPGDNNIAIPYGTAVPARASTSVTLQGNLDAAALAGDSASTAIQVYDPQGTPHNLTLVFTKQSSNTWNMAASIPPGDGTMVDATINNIVFNGDGSFQSAGDLVVSFQIPSQPAPQPLTLSFGTAGAFNGLTQFGNPSSASAIRQDGYTAGFLTDVTVAQDGVIEGIFTNGQKLPIAQLAIASFTNPGGLNREGDNYLALSANSGLPIVGAGSSGGRGAVRAGVLEQSNVDIALEFTRMITAQRGFQVNSRTIVASNEVLQELANIIR